MLWQAEGGGSSDKVNKYGYAGKYQLGKAERQAIGKQLGFIDKRTGAWTGKDGVHSLQDWLKSPKAQDEFFQAYTRENWKTLERLVGKEKLKAVIGTKIAGITMTESGILAGAHLGGAGSVRDFINSGGKTIAVDGSGKKSTDYMAMGANKDVSSVTGNPHRVFKDIGTLDNKEHSYHVAGLSGLTYIHTNKDKEKVTVHVKVRESENYQDMHELALKRSGMEKAAQAGKSEPANSKLSGQAASQDKSTPPRQADKTHLPSATQPAQSQTAKVPPVSPLPAQAASATHDRSSQPAVPVPPPAVAAPAQAAEQVRTLLPADQKHLAQEARSVLQALQQRDARLQKLDAAQLDNLSGQLAADAARQGMAKINGAVVNAADPGKISLVGTDVGNKPQQVSAAYAAAPAALRQGKPAPVAAEPVPAGATAAQPVHAPAAAAGLTAAVKPQSEQAKSVPEQAHKPAPHLQQTQEARVPGKTAPVAHVQPHGAQPADHAQAKSHHPQPVQGADRGSRMVNAALEHFGDGTFEYGRGDMAGQLANKKKPNGNRIDGSRLEEDKDKDGKKGVDCSSLVWRTLQLGNTKVTDDFKSAANFTTHTLFNGGHGGQHPHANVSDYAKRNFNLIDNKKDLQPGDILMFKMEGGGQHVAVYKGKNEKGEQIFYGSQTSTGPAEVNLSSNPYWSKQDFLGALRPKDDFYKPEAGPQAAQQASQQREAARHPGLSEGKQSLLNQAQQHVSSMQQRDGRLKDLASHHIDNLSAALAVEGWKKGIEKVGAVVVNAVDPGKISMLYKSAANKVEHAAVELKDAIKQSAQHSLSLLAAAPEHGQEPAKPQAHQQLARAKQPGMGM
ncbi:NlpC/P60 family protein [Chromobacterium sphagni]|uniref:NlpC/P60 domain-containing protein n=1 Tax=Chromobacterium sphagni TaxID=1903179 RepID=A0ABX3C924_9NEIS|nr:NlpC/P60 family protein [Chromobacterium sphagni]OHX18095.1 hypothetical protein BI344_11190 [Chromobacterium sphagni]